MMLSSAPQDPATLRMVEGGLTVIAIAVAFCWPRLGASYFKRIERTFAKLARRRGLSVAVVGIAAFALRLAILPLCPVPRPFCPDDFSFLLAANTFAAGRLTNPTPAMWVHFESIHITMKPTYMSMYFPAQGLLLAGGKILTGHPWYGILFSMALMCAALCWALQAWLPPKWALLGGVIAILHLGLFSAWVNTYHTAGSVSALGGALVLGAFPRLRRTVKFRYGMLLAIGIVLLATSRPYEGLLLCLPVAFVLGKWALFGKGRPAAAVLLRRAALPLLLIIAAGAWMGYYDYRNFGNPLTPPYKVDRATYAVAPYYVWQPPRPMPAYRHAVLRKFYTVDELRYYNQIHNVRKFIPQCFIKVIRGIIFFAGLALLPPLIMLRRVFLDRRMRFLVLCTAVMIAGMLIEIYLLPHYLAPFIVLFYALGLQATRHLRFWRPGDQPVGTTLVRYCVLVCFIMAGLRLYAQPLHLEPAEFPPTNWFDNWYGPAVYGMPRAQIESHLESLPGKQLVIVRYSEDHNPLDEWVYNAPDIDTSKVIWARDMGPAQNLELIHYYTNRTVWLVQPDTNPASISPYVTNLSPAPAVKETAALKGSTVSTPQLEDEAEHARLVSDGKH